MTYFKKKLTPNEVAKLEMYEAMESVFYDGVRAHYAVSCTEREEAEVRRQVHKKTSALYKQWGIEKIRLKMGWEVD